MGGMLNDLTWLRRFFAQISLNNSQTTSVTM